MMMRKIRRTPIVSKKKKKKKEKKKKKKKKKIKIERSTSGTIYAKCTLPDRPPTAAN